LEGDRGFAPGLTILEHHERPVHCSRQLQSAGPWSRPDWISQTLFDRERYGPDMLSDSN
jgi:hypothetical protein